MIPMISVMNLMIIAIMMSDEKSLERTDVCL